MVCTLPRRPHAARLSIRRPSSLRSGPSRPGGASEPIQFRARVAVLVGIAGTRTILAEELSPTQWHACFKTTSGTCNAAIRVRVAAGSRCFLFVPNCVLLIGFQLISIHLHSPYWVCDGRAFEEVETRACTVSARPPFRLKTLRLGRSGDARKASRRTICHQLDDGGGQQLVRERR